MMTTTRMVNHDKSVSKSQSGKNREIASQSKFPKSRWSALRNFLHSCEAGHHCWLLWWWTLDSRCYFWYFEVSSIGTESMAWSYNYGLGKCNFSSRQATLDSLISQTSVEKVKLSSLARSHNTNLLLDRRTKDTAINLRQKCYSFLLLLNVFELVCNYTRNHSLTWIRIFIWPNLYLSVRQYLIKRYSCNHFILSGRFFPYQPWSSRWICSLAMIVNEELDVVVIVLTHVAPLHCIAFVRDQLIYRWSLIHLRLRKWIYRSNHSLCIKYCLCLISLLMRRIHCSSHIYTQLYALDTHDDVGYLMMTRRMMNV